jgi:hypothetical protein
MNGKASNSPDISGPIAWTLSVGMHIGVGLLVFFITWSVIREEEEPPRVVTAMWHEQPIVEEATPPVELPHEPIKEEAHEQIESQQNKERPMPEPITDGFAVLHEVTTTNKVPVQARRKPETEVKFMGLDAIAAKRIVYVVDASGTMLLYINLVFDELEQSLRLLHPKQEFGIVFFRNNKAIAVPPKGKLAFAKPSNIDKAMLWIREKVVAAGYSNPTDALKTAVRLKPDVIYLLSEDITGEGEYEVLPDELLASIDKLNPIDSRNGLRRVQINCIQYLSQDKNGIMERIAEIHGGEDGYTFIERGKVVK